MPAAMAPEDTMTTSVPAFIRASMASASPASRPASNTPDGVVSALVPTLTTRLRAVRMASRCSVTSVVTVFAALTPGGLALGGADAIAALQPRIGAPARHRNLLSRRRLRLPVERHFPDGHGAAGLRTQPQQFLFDAQTRARRSAR